MGVRTIIIFIIISVQGLTLDVCSGLIFLSFFIKLGLVYIQDFQINSVPFYGNFQVVWKKTMIWKSTYPVMHYIFVNPNVMLNSVQNRSGDITLLSQQQESSATKT